MKSSHVCGSPGGPCISLICPSTNTALARNGLRLQNACGSSSLNAHSQVESMVMLGVN